MIKQNIVHAGDGDKADGMFASDIWKMSYIYYEHYSLLMFLLSMS